MSHRIKRPTPDSGVPPLITALMDPRRYPHAAPSVERLETHISWVLLAGDYAYKIKKPVALGFLDFSTLEARHHYCLEELRLNSATAPQIYLEVLPITGSAAEPLLGGSGAPIEYALKMRRFAQDALLDGLDRRGELDAALIDGLAAVVAAFHEKSAIADAAGGHGSPANITQPALDNFTQMGALAPPAAGAARLERLRAWTAAESARLEDAFTSRKAQGRVRECHGDLHLGNIAIIDGAPTPFDCIEFNPEFRWIDVISEIAFLVMDLLDRGRAALAWRCLNRYLEIGGDYEGVAVLRYYLVYRAMVRAKVALIHAHQPVAGAVRQSDEKNFTHHVRLAETFAAPPRPALILMHGVAGSGKTTVAQALVEALGAIRVRSDVERKRLHGLGAAAASGSAVGAGLYDAETTRRTYTRLERVADIVLRAGWPVIVDATCLRRTEREAFRQIARAAAVPFVLVSCCASEQVLRERLARRRALAEDASEATAEVLAHQLEIHEPPGGDEAGDVIVIDATAAAAEIVARVSARLNQAQPT